MPIMPKRLNVGSHSLNMTVNITTYIIYKSDMEIYIYMYNAICQIENFFYKFHFSLQCL